VDLTVTFIGNATTLIRCAGLTVLTDPNFLHQGQRAYLGHGLVSRRLREPALRIEDLPPLDMVVPSHLHGDHWDRVAETGLDHGLPIATTPHAAKRLHHRGFGNASGLQTWQHRFLQTDGVRLTVTALPGRHAPVPINRLLPPVMGSMLEFAAADQIRRVYISGDTLLIDELADIPKRFEGVDAGIVHLGGTRLPAGRRLPFGLTVTMDGRQGAQAVQDLDLTKVIPVHFDDYGVFASPLSDFLKEMANRGLADRVIDLRRGQTVTV
jgi:L-ascorbate metabolism protein UlaG (beta-lactamase superfamily)